MMTERPQPVGRIVELPHLKGATQADKEAFLRDFLSTGPPAGGPVTAFQDEPEPEPAPAAVFDPSALLQPLPGRSERYTMPNGQVVWVHPPSLQDAACANRLALSEVKKLGLLTEGKYEEAELEARMRGQVYQVVYVCRTGPEITSACVFKEQHAEALRRNPGYVEVVQQICALSDRLTSGQSEADLLREGFADFFGAMESVLGTLLSQRGTVSSETIWEWLEACANSVSVLSQQNDWTANRLRRAARMLDPIVNEMER